MSTCSLTYGSGTSYPVPDGRKLAEGPTPVNIDFSADRGPGAGGNATGRAPMRGPALGLSLDLADVGGLEPLRAPAHLALDPITLGQALEARSLDGAEVHEHILATLLGDETEPLRIVEPLHAALSHLYLPLSCEAFASVMPHHHGGGALRDRKANKNAAGLKVLAALISNLANAHRDGSGAVACPQPTGNGHGEASRRAPRHHHVHLTRRGKLGDEVVGAGRLVSCEAQVRAFSVVVVGEERAVGHPHRLVEMSGEVRPAPALVAEGASVLGSDYDHGVRVEGKVLDVPQGTH